MWQHEIIAEALRKFPSGDVTGCVADALRRVECFNFGAPLRAAPELGLDTAVFQGFGPEDHAMAVRNMRFPFGDCILEYGFKEGGKLLAHEALLRESGAVLILDPFGKWGRFLMERLVQKEFLFFSPMDAQAIADRKLVLCFAKGSDSNAWILNPLVGAMDPLIGKVMPVIFPALDERHVLFVKSLADSYNRQVVCDCGLAADLLFYLNCSNICTERVVPSAKMNKARTKKRREPFHEYRVLKLNPGLKQAKHSDVPHPWGENVPGMLTAAHLCRGHFKTYTADAPLFGKHVGTFWWGPQMRGDLSAGVVEKDYEVEPPKGPEDHGSPSLS